MSRTRIWWIPLLFAALLAGVGFNAYRTLETTMREDLRGELQTLLSADVLALRIWTETQQAAARIQAGDDRVRVPFARLAAIARAGGDVRGALLAAPERVELTNRLAHAADIHQHTGFGVVDAKGILLAGNDEMIGRRSVLAPEILRRVVAGETLVTKPGMWRDRVAGRSIDDDQVMLVLAPIPVADGESGALGFGISALRDFSRILKVARMGESGETYALDVDGLMLSESRFDDQLRAIGLIDDAPDSHSAMHVQVRDPGGNMVAGHEPQLPVLARPLTRMAASVVQRQAGFDVEGYSDYRGVPVLGAWTWLEDLEIGVATEIDVAEAFSALHALQRNLAAVVGLLVIAAVGMFLYSAMLVRMNSRVDRAQRLGRYRIFEKIGEGGMGSVYRAHHALLRRPTAVKLLHREKSDPESVARFEREVQVASDLTHPNTIAIYDYGHTPEGIFYYAMEYLDGITLAQCVEGEGPQPEARVVYVLKQVCGSLAEAHARTLIHRDLKPANIMLCERGGMFDFVKVLDFGLVRTESQPDALALTGEQSLSGTPLYLSPEAIEAPERIDVRSDVYQIGAIAYFLLAGRNVFQGRSVVEVLSQHLNAEPEPIAKVRGSAISKGLEEIVLRCLAKDPAARYANAAELLAAFEACEASGGVAGHWGLEEARVRWQEWREQHPAGESLAPEPASYPSGYQVDVAGRLGSTSSED